MAQLFQDLLLPRQEVGSPILEAGWGFVTVSARRVQAKTCLLRLDDKGKTAPLAPLGMLVLQPCAKCERQPRERPAASRLPVPAASHGSKEAAR